MDILVAYIDGGGSDTDMVFVFKGGRRIFRQKGYDHDGDSVEKLIESITGVKPVVTFDHSIPRRIDRDPDTLEELATWPKR